MADPTLEAIRARSANATSVLWQTHGPRDVAWLLERVDSLEARVAELSTPAQHVNLINLTPCERGVVEGLVSGARLSAIAAAQGVSKHTARYHLKRAFRKLGVGSQVELLAKLGGRNG